MRHSNHMVGFIKRNKYICLLLVIGVLAYWRWLFTPGIFATGDWNYMLHQTAQYYLTFPLWNSLTNFGGVDDFSWRLPLNFLYGILGLFKIDKNIAEIFLVFWPTIIAGLSGGFLLIRRFFDERAAFVGALVLNFNSYYLVGPTHFLLYSAGAFGVLAIYFYLRSLDGNDMRHYVFVSITLFITGAYDLRVLYLTAFIIFTYFLYRNITERPLFALLRTKAYMKHHVVMVLVLIGLFAFWLLGTATSNSLLENNTLGRALFGNSYWNIEAALALFHPFWTGGTVEWFTAHPVPLFFWLVPLLAALGLFFNRRNKIVLYFALVALLGILLTKQVDMPFPGLYSWLYDKLPGFNAFREATKFYYFIVLGYAVLIAALINYLFSQTDKIYRNLGWATMALSSVLFTINLIPVTAGTLDAMSKARSMPADYRILNNFLDKDKSDYRLLWLPRSSQWSAHTSIHPEVDATDFVTQKEAQDDKGNQVASKYAIAAVLNSNGNKFLANDIKYIVVPIRDINDDDLFSSNGDDRSFFIDALSKNEDLTRVNIGTSDLAIFENKQYRAHVYTSEQLLSFDTLDSAIGASAFINSEVKGKTDYTLKENSTKSIPTTPIEDIFSNLNNTNFSPGTITPNVAVPDGSSLFINTNRPALRYQVVGNKLNFFQSNLDNLFISKKPVSASQPEQLVKTINLDPNKQYYLETDSGVLQLDQQNSKNLGPAPRSAVVFSSENQNLIKNPSFESGLWQRKVADCNHYDDRPLIGMAINTSLKTDGFQSLELNSVRHTACTQSDTIPVTPGSYLLRFNYRGEYTRIAGFKVTFNNSSQAAISQDLPVTDTNWKNFATAIQVPNGVSRLTLQVMGYPSDQLGGQQLALTGYDNFKLEPLAPVGAMNINTNPVYAQIPLGPTDQITYQDQSYNFTNLIPNGSFEAGTWQKEVGDCNAYDNQPVIAMRTTKDTASDGRTSLELDATKHTACTSTNRIPIKEDSDYYFSFDYSGLNADNASYYLSFDDPAHTVYSEKLPVKGEDWHSYIKSIRAPGGAKTAVLSIYSYPTELGNRKIITRYDNFKLLEIPRVQQAYYLLHGSTDLKAPEGIQYRQQNDHRTTISIEGATKSFYLNISEAYHSKWRLEILNKKMEGLYGWWPIARPDEINQNNHFKLNNLTNGWYIDVDQLCKQQHLCKQNADGSYDIEMVAEFTPQRWFNVGLIISGLTLLGCLSYLGYSWYRRRKEVTRA
jgi:hypothetical protein